MNVKTYNIFMILATAIAWLGFFIIINNFDPISGNWIVFTMFYAVLFLAILGSLSLIGYWWRRLLNRRKEMSRFLVSESFRQAIIFSAVAIIALWLQASRILTWWNILLLIVSATLLEFIIILFKQNNGDKLNT
jgi:hypothetical protein